MPHNFSLHLIFFKFPCNVQLGTVNLSNKSSWAKNEKNELLGSKPAPKQHHCSQARYYNLLWHTSKGVFLFMNAPLNYPTVVFAAYAFMFYSKRLDMAFYDNHVKLDLKIQQNFSVNLPNSCYTAKIIILFYYQREKDHGQFLDLFKLQITHNHEFQSLHTFGK